MSLLKRLEEEADLLLQELKERVKQQISVGNKIDPTLHELIQHLKNHVNPTPADPAPAPVVAAVVDTPAPAPVVPAAVVEETVVVAAKASK